MKTNKTNPWKDNDWTGDETAGVANMLTWALDTDLYTASLCAEKLIAALGKEEALKVAGNLPKGKADSEAYPEEIAAMLEQKGVTR